MLYGLRIRIMQGMQSSSVTTRETYWDTVKALLIFLVILGHVVQFFMYHDSENLDFWGDPMFKGIYIFHMPLFMLISGFFAAKSIAKRGYLALPRYVQRLIIPCVGMGGITFFLALLKIKFFWDIYIGCTTLWFLIVAFECVVFYTIMQWKQIWWYQVILFIVPIPLAIICGQNPCISLFWPHSSQFSYLWPIFVLGAYMSHQGFTPHQINSKWVIFPLFYIAVFFFFPSDWHVYRLPLTFSLSSLTIDILRTIAAIIGCGTTLWACRYIHQVVGKYEIAQKIGQATLALYVLQTLFFAGKHCITPWLSQPLGHTKAISLSLIILLVLHLTYIITRRIESF